MQLAFCLLLRQLQFSKTKFYKANCFSLGCYQTESTYCSLTCFVLFSESYPLFESSHWDVFLEVLIL